MVKGSHTRAETLLLGLLAFYGVLITYMSLTPFVGWTQPADGWLAYLAHPWPHYYTQFDLLVNVLGYVPLGLLAYAVAQLWLSRGRALCLAMALGVLASFALETLQAALPARIASNVDLVSNSLGCALGAFGGYWFVGRTALSPLLHRWRQQLFMPGAATEFGLVLLVAWLFSQLNPSTPFLGAGMVRVVFEWPWSGNRTTFQTPLVLGMAFNLCGLGLLVLALTRNRLTGLVLTQALVASAFCCKLLAGNLMLKPYFSRPWHDHETLLAIAVGSLLLLALTWVPRRARLYLAAVVLLTGAIMTKLAGYYAWPEFALRIFNWNYGQLRNFTGLTLYLNELWPLVAFLFSLVLLFRTYARATVPAAHSDIIAQLSSDRRP